MPNTKKREYPESWYEYKETSRPQLEGGHNGMTSGCYPEDRGSIPCPPAIHCPSCGCPITVLPTNQHPTDEVKEI